MRKIVFSVFLLMFGSAAWCQGGNYLYIDAFNGQLFYVKFKDKIHSSSQSGYVLITGIKDNTSEINIGFPGNSFPEQRFSIPMKNNDQGFYLKNTDKGWELLNLKTSEVLMNGNVSSAADINQVRKTDAFSLLLSRVVNDSAVLIADSKLKEQSPVSKTSVPAPADPVPVKDTVQKETVATAPVQQTVKADTSTTFIPKQIVKDTAKKEVAILNPPVSQQEPVKKDKPEVLTLPSPVRKLFDQRFEKVYEATYIDSNNGKNDTVRISYPISNTENADNKPVATPPVITVTTVPETTVKDTAASEPPASSEPAGGCRFVANDQDVDNLRVQLLSAHNVDEKIATAKAHFRSKCFMVKQIKALSELFPGDEDKYRLFDTAYPYTSDSANFSSLAGLLKEDYYKKRFEAIIRK